MESPTQNSPYKARALWYVEQGRVELRPQQVFRAQGEVLLRMVWSGISRGTERLIFRGQVPPAEFARMRAPLQDGSFPYPVKYGYCAVGRVEPLLIATRAVRNRRRLWALHSPRPRLFKIGKMAMLSFTPALRLQGLPQRFNVRGLRRR
jgi:hypothetical protein